MLAASAVVVKTAAFSVLQKKLSYAMHISTYIYGYKLRNGTLKEIGVFTIYDFRLRFLSFEPCSANFIIYARRAQCIFIGGFLMERDLLKRALEGLKSSIFKLSSKCEINATA